MTLTSQTSNASRTPAITPRVGHPIRWWAAIGAGAVVLQAVIYGRWLTSSDLHRTPAGTTPVPGWLRISTVTWECVSTAALLFLLWWFIFRPWRRHGRLTIDGMFVFAFLSMYWQDPLANYTQAWVTYNAAFLNLGSWSSAIPGWTSPRGHLFVEPFLFSFPLYAWSSMLAVVLTVRVMRAAKNRWPRLGTAGLIGVALGACIALDVVFETLWMRTGIYALPGSDRSFTLFAGRSYQIPVYEFVLTGIMFGTFGCLRYFVNGRGETVPERGLADLHLSARASAWLRLLACMGVMNATLFVTYSVPIQWFAIHASAWPAEIMARSYLTDDICGPGTTYTCPGGAIPIPTTTSLHVAPDGTLHPR